MPPPFFLFFVVVVVGGGGFVSSLSCKSIYLPERKVKFELSFFCFLKNNYFEEKNEDERTGKVEIKEA